MTRKLTVALAAFAIAITGLTATPAVALGDRERDALKIILGAAAIGLIVNQIEKRNDRRQTPAYTTRPNRDYWKRPIPADCIYEIRGSRGWESVVGKRCIQRSNYRGRLPEACEFRVRGKNHNRTVYGLRCLRSKGFRVETVRN